MPEHDPEHDPDQDAEGFLLSDTHGTGFVRGADGLDGFRIKEVTYAVVDGRAIFEGCIVLGTVEEMNRIRERVEELGGIGPASVVEDLGNLRTGQRFRWAKGIVPFHIDPDLVNPERVTGAINAWQEKTDIAFVERTTERDFVTFRPDRGCSSNVGRQRGEQFINLGAGCSLGNTIHEIGHTLGLWHEQSRADRDEFVEVRVENIRSSAQHNFDQTIRDGDPHGEYDYGSIMHYPGDAFSRNGRPTIVPKNGHTIGQRDGLSEGDVRAIQDAYATEFAKRTA